MVEIIPEIKALGKKQHGECLAGELLLYLGIHSFVPMFDKDGNPCNYGKRDSDAPADEALVELITAVNDSENIYHDIPWETKKADWLQTILSGKTQLSTMGVDGYFEKSECLLRA
ncbi:hypothetical protein HYALB_00007510 [Hymenoscyphus albidus]|uniref:Uncharacterized protein n=1 Tax=Hymenoscyphus albidus TaxID=595503 RepID=A0A9N9LWV4_9HELO|nr:hypothetical protein HYALB_00007510 [Hymenoscyphus albidus]